ncbi:ATP-binding protein [Aestuariimicrobium ganziense]|uniref:ATP-binding protein n=1 Tax=Aestuariimicrobium ganziense TaxID=2773677 RepID=UPI0019432333|nr:biotin carboxylase N-terminal domain-containing protein [Aestuariimicrobium ganziense]
MLKRIAVVNRGEAAMRLIHAVRDLNAAARPDDEPISVIALYTDAERTAMFVREADEAQPLGPAANRPYLDHDLLLDVLRRARADAVWVGWGFVAEDAAFADRCTEAGITFIGPTGESMRQLGDKIGSKLIAESVGVPVAPWSGGPVDTVDDALAAAERIGYPVMLKATAGGGGRGIRLVSTPDELTDAYQRTRDEAERAFGSGVVFLEKVVTGARHVEVQLIADHHGTAWAVGVRDCSIQRRNQKVIEESASPLLLPEEVAELKAAAERLALAVGYRGAGTVEFLFQPFDRSFAFLEVNTRLQVEHPITEVVTGLDLVQLQIHVADGGRLDGGVRPAEVGHAVEARLNAEDPDRDFAPSPGRIVRLQFPSGPGIRVDTGVAEGDAIVADFDSMIAKVIAHGRTRDEALARLRRAMAETTVVIEGGTTNKSFVLDLLDQPEVATGHDAATAEPGHWADTAWIDRVRAQGRLGEAAWSGVALVAAAIEAYGEAEQVELARLLESARGGRPQVQHVTGRPIDLKLRGATHQVTVARVGADRYHVVVLGGEQPAHADVRVQTLDDFHSRLTVNGQVFRLVTHTSGPMHLVEVNGITHRVSRDEGGVVRSPAPALVVATPVAVGDEVAADAPVLVLESMKMETVLTAPFAGRVRELLVAAGSQVETGAPLVRLEPTGDADETTATADATASVDLPAPAEADDNDEQFQSALATLRAGLQGYDLDDTRAALTEFGQTRATLRAAGGHTLESEMALLSLFADLAELSRNRPVGEDLATELRVHSAREHFHSYLRTLDVERGGLPVSFEEKLRTVLAHYGVDDLDRSPALHEAVFRIFLSQQRPARVPAGASAGLEAWLDEQPPTGERADAARDLLERLVRTTQRRFPRVGDLARSVRFRWFDQPQVDAERDLVLDRVRTELDALSADPAPADRESRIEALADIPEQLIEFLAARMRRGLGDRDPMLEVLVRRHYREFDLGEVSTEPVAGRPAAVADYRISDRDARVIALVFDADALTGGDPTLTEAVASLVSAAREQQRHPVVELHVLWPQAPVDAREQAEQLRRWLADQAWSLEARRVTVAVVADDERPTTHTTFRARDVDRRRELVEDRLVSGVHPMLARQLSLWRLSEFEITRLDSPHGVLLYECVARSNPADRRLIAMAQVRQLAVTRDRSGRVVGLPHAERAVQQSLEAIRRARSARGSAGNQLVMNHIWLHIWPVVRAELDDLAALQSRIRPLGEAAGLEEVLAQGRVLAPDGTARPVAIRFHAAPGAGVTADIGRIPDAPLKPMDDYDAKVERARRRGLVYPYELQGMLAGPGGTVTELDLDESGHLVPVDRPAGQNRAGIIVADVTTPTPTHPEGVRRIVLSGDPIKALGAVAEPECSRIIAAIDRAEAEKVPLEWYTISSGARISMESGTENMDWVAAALKRIVEFTQAGGEVNVVVAGINVGAQPYWNAEATMLMHTRGVLVMTPDSAMVLTGKQSLDFSGGVSAEDNFGIGGFDRVMGPNGQAQYWAPTLAGAYEILMRHYEHTYVAPGEQRPRDLPSVDPVDRDISDAPHAWGTDFTTIGEVFSKELNPDRKKAFDIRAVIRAVADQDRPQLERWAQMADAETAVVVDTTMGGHPVCIVGIESRPVPRRGFPPTDGPDTYTAGTLFPRSSKKVARALNAASGNRPVVVLANLSGFDGSPDSMRHLQLEYGAEIGRAIVNFEGTIVFCVISRYHGGAFVVFSKALNPNMTVLALEGSFASVIGGAPAAAVVFAGEVAKRVAAHPEVARLRAAVESASGAERSRLSAELADAETAARAEKIGEVAAEFDGVHDIHRAVEVGSVDEVVSVARLRPTVIEVIRRSRG